MAPAFRAPSFYEGARRLVRRSPKGEGGNAEKDDGLPGAAKNTGDDACLLGSAAAYFSAGATVTSPMPLFLSDAATKPEAFISSTKTFR